MNFLVSKKFDFLWIIGPAFYSSFFVLLLNLLNLAPQSITPLYWLIFVVFIDVSHVWSTLFRTYLHKERRAEFQKELWVAPILCYGTGVILYALGDLIFWRCLAYLAVFHFIRQQYGIYRIYHFKNKDDSTFWFINALAIYSSTIIPLILWHLSGPSSINWFIEGDFFYYEWPELIPFFKISSLVILLLYFLKEKLLCHNKLHSTKNYFLIGSLLSWWLGIVWLKNDWAFTLTNVIAHGVPYFALIYLNDLKQRDKIIWWRTLPTLTVFIFLFAMGFMEEWLWDLFIWKEHLDIFPFSSSFQEVESLTILTLIVPLLTLPQATHYVLDGFIWKRTRNI